MQKIPHVWKRVKKAVNKGFYRWITVENQVDNVD